jgi:hypothetical protein
MGYDTEAYYKYEKIYNKKRKALEYLFMYSYIFGNNKQMILEKLKHHLTMNNTDFELSALIEAIKVVKRNLTIKIGIKHE